MSDNPDLSRPELEDDITDDLTVDGADLLAELRAEHARVQSEQDSPELEMTELTMIEQDQPDDLTIDGTDLLAELRTAVENTAVDKTAVENTAVENTAVENTAGEGAPAEDADLAETVGTVGRWRPAPDLPPPAVVVDQRAGRPNRAQLIAIAAVVLTSLVVGGYLLLAILREAPPDTEQQDDPSAELDTNEPTGADEPTGQGGVDEADNG